MGARSTTDLDGMVLLFGKHKGKAPREVAKADPGWIVWAHANILNNPVCTRELATECEELLQQYHEGEGDE